MSIADALKQISEPIVVPGKFDLSVEMKKNLPMETVYDPPEPDQSYRVSNVIKLCARQEVLRHIHKVKLVDKVDATLRKTFDIGRAFHTLVQNEWFADWRWLYGTWECLRCENRVEDSLKPKLCPKCFKNRFEYVEPEPSNLKLGITGHMDGILLVHGKKYIIELKTINSMQYGIVVNSNRKPMDRHISQIQMYMFLSGITEGFVLYFGKNDSETHYFEQSYESSLIQPILDNLEVARAGMKTHIVPERTVCKMKSCSRARKCPVRDICFK